MGGILKKVWFHNVPNYATIGNLISGCVGIERMFAGDYLSVFICIIIAAILDFADGFLARALGVSGDMGRELDSLADLVTFGVLPGLVVYHYITQFGYCTSDGFCSSRYAWLAIPVGAAWRLARFNISPPGAGSFTGVPVPITGIALASLVLVFETETGKSTQGFLTDIYGNFYFLAMAPVIAAYFMVSDFPMIALKKFAESRIKIVLLLAAIVITVFVFQFAAGPLVWIMYVIVSLLTNFAKLK